MFLRSSMRAGTASMAIMGSIQLPNPLLTQLAATKRAVQVAKVAAKSHREDQPFQWALTGLMTEFAAHELQKQAKDDSQQ